MAVCSEVRFNNIFKGLDTAAEHYHPAKLKWLSCFEVMGGDTINHVASSIRQIAIPSPDMPVFDLSAARKHILQKDDSQAESRISSKKVAQSGDVIISRLRSYLKQVAFIPTGLGQIHLSTEFIVLRGNAESDIRFLVPYLLSEPIQTILQWSQDGNEHPRFNEQILLKLPVVPEVRKIANILGRLVDEAASSLSISKNLYKQAVDLLLSELGLANLDLSPNLFYERPFSETLKSSRLDAEFFQPVYQKVIDTCYAYKGGAAALVTLLESMTNGVECRTFVEKGVPYIRVGDMDKLRIRSSDAVRISADNASRLSSKIALKEGDILTARSGSIGQACVVTKRDLDSILSSHLMRLRPHENCPLLSDCLALFLATTPGIHQILKNGNGGIVPEISQPFMKRVVVPILAKRIQEQLSELIQKSHQAENESKSLLEKAVQMVEKAVLGGDR